MCLLFDHFVIFLFQRINDFDPSTVHITIIEFIICICSKFWNRSTIVSIFVVPMFHHALQLWNLKNKRDHRGVRDLKMFQTCLAASSALSLPKQKRDILPGDPRYDEANNHHHHHHQNVVEDVKSVGDLYAELPQNTYGSQSSVPLNNQYLLPVDDVGRQSASVPNSYGVPDTIQVTEINNSIVEDCISVKRHSTQRINYVFI